MSKSSSGFVITLLALGVVSVLLLIIGCSKDSSTGPGGGGNTGAEVDSFLVGPAGDTLVTTDGHLSLVIPPGALTAAQTITVAAINPPANFVDESCYQFGPDSLEFLAEAILTITYDESKLPPGSSEASLAICRIVGSEWETLTSTLNKTTNKLTAALSSFSSYGARAMSSGQVYEGSYEINSQATCDAFGAQYTGITGYLKINGEWEQFSDLSPLVNLTWVGGSLTIVWLDSIHNLEGLNSLEAVGGDLKISYCDNLETFSGLGALGSIGDDIFVDHNLRLEQMSGFHPAHIEHSIVIEECASLQDLIFLTGHEFLWTLFVKSCPALTSLAGLEALTRVDIQLRFDRCNGLLNLNGLELLNSTGTLEISECDYMVSLNGLSSLQIVKGLLRIWDNPRLQSLGGLSHVYHVGSLDIYDNDDTGFGSLGGLNNLRQIGWIQGGSVFRINYNNYLTNITALNNLLPNPSTGWVIPCDFVILSNISMGSGPAWDLLDAIGGEDVVAGQVIIG
jgi:hypothetical protein